MLRKLRSVNNLTQKWFIFLKAFHLPKSVSVIILTVEKTHMQENLIFDFITC